MFWSANYIVVKELNFLLKEENVTLSQVLEADDILQECKADNKALIQFLTRPEILAELITLITEEPPKNVELATQYRHANIACEVLTSQLGMLSDRLSQDVVQMNRLCDFLNRDPPLNPLLASYFSKTVEMLLERSPKQDWYLYHIVCLRVLDFFKSRRDFLPNLLRHISTSAIADTFKYFIRLDDLFKKTVMEWLEEHQFLECLIQIICGTYVPEEFHAVAETNPQAPEQPEKGLQEQNEKVDVNHKDETMEAHGADDDDAHKDKDTAGVTQEAGADQRAQDQKESEERALRAARVAAVASANAAALLCELVVNGCAGEGCTVRPRASWWLVTRLVSEASVRALLAAMFTSPAHARRHALVNGCQLLLTMLSQDRLSRTSQGSGEEESGRSAECAVESGAVELAVAPHLPLLHQSLLHQPHETGSAQAVGLARVQVVALLAQLALSEVEEVATTMLTLGTPGVVLELFFRHADNNLLHAQTHALVCHALANRLYRRHYARHLLIECDLLTRLMNAFEDNKSPKEGCARAAYMGHVVSLLARLSRELAPEEEPPVVVLPDPLLQAWRAFVETELAPTLQLHETPLGGCYPPENIYEVENMAETLEANYEFTDLTAPANMDDLADDGSADDANEMCGLGGVTTGSSDFIADELDLDDEDKMRITKSNFLELASQRFNHMWEDSPTGEELGGCSGEFSLSRARDVLQQPSPWETGGDGCAAGEGWAQFGEQPFPPPADPFAPPPDHAAQHPPFGQDEFTPFWSYGDRGESATSGSADAELESSLRGLRLHEEQLDAASSASLANNLLTAMSGMSADAIANIVNANLPPAPAACAPPAAPAPAPAPAAAERAADR